MPDLADLFPGFASHWIDTSIGTRFRAFGRQRAAAAAHARLRADQRNVAPRGAGARQSASRWCIPDLPGYGWSVVAAIRCTGTRPTTSARWRTCMVELMEQLGHVRFRLAGHDRGGRVAYRLALDHPGRVERLAVLDIVPTYEMWHRMDTQMAMKVWHWPFLAQPISAARDADRQGARRISRLQDGELDQGEGPLRLRSARACALSRLLLRSAAHPRDLRGLPRRQHDSIWPMTRPTARPARRSPAACGALGRGRHPERKHPGRSRSGANGRRTCRASRSIPGISCARKIRTPQRGPARVLRPVTGDAEPAPTVRRRFPAPRMSPRRCGSMRRGSRTISPRTSPGFAGPLTVRAVQGRPVEPDLSAGHAGAQLRAAAQAAGQTAAVRACGRSRIPGHRAL